MEHATEKHHVAFRNQCVWFKMEILYTVFHGLFSKMTPYFIQETRLLFGGREEEYLELPFHNYI